VRCATPRHFRARQGHPFDDAIHCSDAGSQYTAMHFTESVMLGGLKAWIGSAGDALNNGLAETTIGLYKTECIREGSPFRSGPIRSLADLEHITCAWVSRYNSARLMHRLGRRPPTEAEAEYYARLGAGKRTDHR
jgi:putative transposase